MSVLAKILSQILSIKGLIKISVSGLLGYLTVLALLTFFSVEMNQGVMAGFFARLMVFIVVFVVIYMLLSLFIKALR
jgi:hypothetical protein